MSSDTPPLVRHLPTVGEIPPDADEHVLADLYRVPDGPFVRANMIATVDGAAWGPDGRSASINDPADWRVFRVLRALADVVLVGAGTARQEGYTGLSRPRGLERLATAPLELAIVTRSGQVPWATLDGPRPPLVVTGRAGAQEAGAAVGEDRVLECSDGTEDGVDLRAAREALTARGLARVLCEGGPGLLADMLAADLVDELCVTTSPMLAGPGPRRIVAAPRDREPGAGRELRLGHLLSGPSGTLLARWEVG
ncbi:dihydrofolate reductase family protein [Isoptericola sp. b408]|uniref:dihydrofolate reductase family protein n=1 Tax=Isoptericola sp. b408 TaxID=3064653 RepID=UPI0027134B58|nr:dihydrofolate reductase family protein [Isoptericola sp. b408]MDO8151306.1 dihydrofolate reductase family protein [Isoptericola sp. b408]